LSGVFLGVLFKRKKTEHKFFFAGPIDVFPTALLQRPDTFGVFENQLRLVTA
jgi:hypothetical protein